MKSTTVLHDFKKIESDLHVSEDLKFRLVWNSCKLVNLFIPFIKKILVVLLRSYKQAENFKIFLQNIHGIIIIEEEKLADI